MGRRLVFVILPAHNEEDGIEELVRRLTAVLDSSTAYNFEAVIVENGATDSTLALLKQASAADPRFRIVRLSRNFRMDGGITDGLDHISGDAAGIMTTDLQDPPELIRTFIAKWEWGYENVCMTVTKRTGVGLIRRFNSRTFYWVADRLTDRRLPERLATSDWLIGRSMKPFDRWTRGIASCAGFSPGLAFAR